ncbi:glycoside hydrolase family 105 protein [Roseobacter sp. HKCCA0434]|uniref:glycoside hydrolase family 88/105 protein n=1 Tax=Roseobacter sp. HKCCA0434 TaxID=3079297 RepID=UPI002905D228|nr:glycoside hydrolase family 88 protein [Roseobacter sp. HKCCA0434]
MLSDYFDAYATAHVPYKGGAWCYEDGLLYRGLELLWRQTGEARWRDHLVRLVDAQIGDGNRLAGYDPHDYNIDNILSGRALLALDEITGDPRYLAAAARLADQLSTHPRTRSGVYWHKLRYPWQVWLDGLYMGLPFQIGYGQRIGTPALVDDALAQLDTALEMTHVPATGLYAHAVDETHKQPWADPDTGQTSAHWARALGWLAMALVDIAELVGPNRFAPFRTRTESLLRRVGEVQRSDGLWLQVIDQPDLEGNYAESSASAMFTYAFLKAASLGLAAPDGRGALRAVAACVERDPDGQRRMQRICHVAGLGQFEGRYRDGTAAYYVSERLRVDDPKGVGPLMMAASLVRSDLSAEIAVG